MTYNEITQILKSMVIIVDDREKDTPLLHQRLSSFPCGRPGERGAADFVRGQEPGRAGPLCAHHPGTAGHLGRERRPFFGGLWRSRVERFRMPGATRPSASRM